MLLNDINKIEELIKFVDGIKFPETKSGRKYAKISKEEFLEKFKIGVEYIEDYDQDDLDGILYACFMHHAYSGKCVEDLSKIHFDFENCEAELLQYDDLVYVKCSVGGDWECYTTCFLYYDGKNIRGYIPEKGNTFNVLSRTAFGSEYDKLNNSETPTEQKIDELFPGNDYDMKSNLIKILALYKMGMTDIFKDFVDCEIGDINFYEFVVPLENYDVMFKDFLKRLGKE